MDEHGPGLKMNFLLKMRIFQCHVSLLEGKAKALFLCVFPTQWWHFRKYKLPPPDFRGKKDRGH